jgi:hypothetical protein
MALSAAISDNKRGPTLCGIEPLERIAINEGFQPHQDELLHLNPVGQMV